MLEPIAEDDEDMRGTGMPEVDRRRSTGKFGSLVHRFQLTRDVNGENQNDSGAQNPDQPSFASAGQFNFKLVRTQSETDKVM